MGSDDLYTELWKACAGPLVDVPCVRERVYYFPQGHMEQVSLHSPRPQIFLFSLSQFGLLVYYLQLEASTNQELNQHIPLFNLPPKILCHVVYMQLLVLFLHTSFCWSLFFFSSACQKYTFFLGGFIL